MVVVVVEVRMDEVRLLQRNPHYLRPAGLQAMPVDAESRGSCYFAKHRGLDTHAYPLTSIHAQLHGRTADKHTRLSCASMCMFGVSACIYCKQWQAVPRNAVSGNVVYTQSL